MKFSSWLRQQTANNVLRSRTRRPANAGFRPTLEALEDRMLLSTFLVTNVGDNGGVNPAPGAGTGTLRQAIVDADAHTGSNTIAFNIPGSGVHTITPLSALPTLTAVGTILNGYTQPGAQANTLAQGDNAVLLIELNGSAAGTGVDGLDVTGGSCTIRGLVINRFTGNGISLSSAGHDVLAGNLLGTDPTGTVAEGNGNTSGQNFPGYGVYVAPSSPSDTIGGTSPAARNLLSGNIDGGSALTSTGGVLEGNYIGTDGTGLKALPNLGVGVALLAGGNTVGGATAGAGNVISGNKAPVGPGGYGISVGYSTVPTARSYVEGNLIGLGADGETAVGNGSYGIYVNQSAQNVQIGGTTAAARNVISSNGAGLWIDSSPTNIVVEGNYIGTDAKGTQPSGNGSVGIETASPGTTIGGTTVGAGNLISGNTGIGLVLVDATGVVVQGNKIGTDATGQAALGNGGDGIYVIDGKNTIGGGTTAARNIVSANGAYGIEVATTTASGNLVEGNYIGTDVNGTTALGNKLAGVAVFGGASGNIIGGTTVGACNIISGNGTDGVCIDDTSNGKATGNVVEGNYIGLATGGTAALPNGGNGVSVNASGNMVGGKATGAGNYIEDNSGAGVDVAGGTGDGILGNSIYLNIGGGIKLAPGANNNQPAPQITFAMAEPTQTVIEGVLFAAPGTTYTIEFFANVTADPSGFGQGQTFLKRIAVTTDASGLGTFIVDLPLVPAGEFITATDTDPGNDTSAFSAAFVVSKLPGSNGTASQLRASAQGMTGQSSTNILDSSNPLSAADQVLANLALLVSNAGDAYYLELSSVAAIWQNIDTLAVQSLDVLLSLKAGVVGMTKDMLMRDLLFASALSSNGV